MPRHGDERRTYSDVTAFLTFVFPLAHARSYAFNCGPNEFPLVYARSYGFSWNFHSLTLAATDNETQRLATKPLCYRRLFIYRISDSTCGSVTTPA
jgi:hypothetical protein